MRYIFFAITSLYTLTAFAQTTVSEDRINHVRRSTVKILINGQEAGTGFFISNEKIATCYHVIFGDLSNNQIPKLIQVIKDDSIKLDVVIPTYYFGELERGQMYDYCLLELKDKSQTNQNQSFLILGNFKDVNEGDWVLSCGFPLNIERAFVSVGLLSTKSKKLIGAEIMNEDTILIKAEIAWLDLTMNKGNSGGAVIALGKTTKDDRVVGIASFIISPYANQATELKNFMKTLGRTGIYYDGYRNIDMYQMFSSAIESNSIGISGCMSIDYFKRTIPKF
jgi:serine protease Do